jgi:hypothetical protein
LCQQLILHPTGASQTSASGRRYKDDQARLPGIPIELCSQGVDVREVCERGLPRDKSRSGFNINGKKDTCQQKGQNENAAF